LQDALNTSYLFRGTTAGSRLTTSLSFSAKLFNARLEELVEELFEEFEEAFEAKYSLERLTGHAMTFQDLQFHQRFRHLHMTSVTEQVASAIDQENTAVGLGVGAGAVLGSMILPGIGTILGGIGGAFFGGLFGPSLEEMKSSTYESIYKAVMGHIANEIIPKLRLMVESKKNDVGNVIMDIITQYLQKYESVVQGLIEEHEDKKRQVLAYISQIDRVTKELIERQDKLERLAILIKNTG